MKIIDHNGNADPGWIIATGIACCIAVLAVLVACILAALLARPAAAHEAIRTVAKPSGWTYPFACCSGYDCREVPSKAIGELADGYIIRGTGEVVGYADKRIKDSPDGEFHWCSVQGANDGRTICLFVPPRSY